MGGVCAIVHFDGEPVREAMLSRMLDQAPYRGAQGVGIRAWGWKALGAQSSFLSRHEAAVEQPLSDRLGRFALVADARIDNAPELLPLLADELHLQAIDPPKATSAQIILAAYARWRERAPEHLIGDFAFVVWDEDRKQLFCARDLFGIKPLHYACLGKRLIVASEAQQVLQYPKLPRSLDRRTAALYLANAPQTQGRSFFEGVEKVPARSCMIWSADESSTRPFWTPGAIQALEYRQEDSYAEQLREILARAVGDRLRSDASRVGIMLSGGLDSSCLAGVAASELRDEQKGRRLVAASYEFPTLSSCDESPFLELVTGSLGITSDRIDCERLGLDLEATSRAMSFETPFVGWTAADAEALQRMSAHGAEVCFTGLGGDELFTGSLDCFSSILLRGQPLQAWRKLRDFGEARGMTAFQRIFRLTSGLMLPRSVERSLRALVGRPTDIPAPPWMDTRLAREAGFPLRPSGDRGSRFFRDPARQRLAALLAEPNQLGRATDWLDCLGAKEGVEVRHPLLDRRLAEFALAVPPEKHFHGGNTKSLLREAVRGLIPEQVRNRRGKTLFGPFLDRCFLGDGGKGLASLIEKPHLATHGFVHGERLQEALHAYRSGKESTFGDLCWYVVTLELWLRKFW